MEPIYVEDRAGRIIFANPACVEAFGRNALSEVMGRDDRAFFDREGAEWIRQNDRRIMDSGVPETVEERVHGGTRVFLSSKTPLRDPDGRLVGLIGVSHDITELRLVQERLIQSEERARLALESGGLGTWTYDPLRQVARWDERACQLFGFPAEGSIALSEAVRAIHPEDRERSLQAVERALAESGTYQLEKRILLPDDSVRWVRTWGLVRGSEADGDRMLIGVVQDINAEKQAELQLEESNRRKDEFLAMLSHELRNPLSAIRYASENIRSNGSDAEVVDLATRVLERQTDHMSRLLEGLLDVSRISTGRLTVERAPVHLSDLVEKVVSDRLQSMAEFGIDIRLNSESAIWVQGDAARLVQVFDNLLSNASKYARQKVEFKLYRSDASTVKAVVRDDGVGLAPGSAEWLFEPFMQGDQDSSRDPGGLGLGLALCRSLVELMDGQIHASSPGVGRGAEFMVTLATTAPPPASAPAEVSRNEDDRKLQILLVEDEEDAAVLLSHLLTREGHHVRLAHDGPTAMAAVQELRPHVVVCDLGLPGPMSGWDVAKGLRETPGGSDLLLVALSGYGRPDDRTASAHAGFDLHLTKPVHRETLLQVLRQASGGPEGTG